LQTFQLITYIGTREAEVTFVLAILLLLKSNMNSTKQIYITNTTFCRSRRPKLEGKTQIDGETEKMK
jgi:hypothetical protein